MGTKRRALVCVLVALSGAAIIAGARLGWVTASGTRPASGIEDTSVDGLADWSYRSCSTYFASFSFAILVTGALVVLGGLLASRFLATLFSLVALAGAGLWIALNATHFNPIGLAFSDLRTGAWLTIAGALVGFACGLYVRRRVD